MEQLKVLNGTRVAPVLGSVGQDTGPQDVSALLSAMLSSLDQATIWDMLCRFFRDLGFAHVLYGYSPDSHGPNLGAREDYLILSTLQPAVLHELVHEGYYLMSATFQWALAHSGVASWSMTPEDCGVGPGFSVSPEGAAFFERNGLMHGCSIGFVNERTRGRGVMALIAPPDMPQPEVDVLLDRLRETIFAVAAVAHRCLSSLPYLPAGRRLTQRQREVLEWVAEGKTSADVAVIMGITVPTVEKHLRLARQSLGVETTAHALMRAAFLNQVFITSTAGFGTDDGTETPSL